MGLAFVDPVTDTIENVYEENEVVPEISVVFLLCQGADPADSIIELCQKKKLIAPDEISLGEGQEPVGLKAINAGAVNGTWVLLQNWELELGLINNMVLTINKLKGRESSQVMILA